MIGKQFLRTSPCVLRVALIEARTHVHDDPMEAVVYAFQPRTEKKLKKVLDGGP